MKEGEVVRRNVGFVVDDENENSSGNRDVVRKEELFRLSNGC